MCMLDECVLLLSVVLLGVSVLSSCRDDDDRDPDVDDMLLCVEDCGGGSANKPTTIAQRKRLRDFRRHAAAYKSTGAMGTLGSFSSSR